MAIPNVQNIQKTPFSSQKHLPILTSKSPDLSGLDSPKYLLETCTTSNFNAKNDTQSLNILVLKREGMPRYYQDLQI